MFVLKAIRTIKSYCEKHECKYCRFKGKDEWDCLFGYVPCDWEEIYQERLKKILSAEVEE